MGQRDWQGKKVTVIGLAIEGEDVARYFAAHGAAVTVSERKPRQALADRAASLEALGVRLHLSSNDPADVHGADLVCVSQSVPLSNPMITAARDLGVPVVSMTSFFLDHFDGPTVGITGSSGKTTTTSLVDAIFTAAGRPHVLGGNIGIGLASLLDVAGREDWAVLEISHTQLLLTEKSPSVAALLRVTPNHLDQFTWREYVALKRKIFAFQGADDAAVFNLDDRVTRELMADSQARRFWFSAEADHGGEGAFLQDGQVFWRRAGRTKAVVKTDEIPMRGFHNVVNVIGATAIAAACDIGPDAVARAVRDFKMPPHRIELVAKLDGVSYYNDSIATTPERTVAALRSFEEKVVLLLGGREKNLPLNELAAEIPQRCRAIICFGEAGPILTDTFELLHVRNECVATLAEAVQLAATIAKPGDVVLLSPAGTSFDAYDNFERRGEHFRELVSGLKDRGEG